MAGLEYRFPPLTEEEKERGRKRLLRSHRPHVARYYKNAESLRRDVMSEMGRNGISIRLLPCRPRLCADRDDDEDSDGP